MTSLSPEPSAPAQALKNMGRFADAHRPAAPTPHVKRLRPLGAFRALRDNPITAFAEIAYEDPIVEVDLFQKLVMVNDPQAIEWILVSNAENYRKSPQQQRRLTPALGDGLLTAEGATWRKTRRIASPLFNPRAIGLLFDDMRDATAAMKRRWRARKAPDAPLDLASEFQRLTYEIVSRTVFSGALDEDRARIHANMAIYFDTFGRIDLSTMLNLPDWLPTFAHFRGKPALSAFRSVVDRVVSGRVADKDREISDLLDRLMHTEDPKTGERLDEIAVSDNVLTFLAAGHETTGNALGWTLYLLALYPEVEEKVLAELRTVLGGRPAERADLDSLSYTRAVVNESLRLYPPAPFIGRQAIGDDRLGDVSISGGTPILIAPWVVHRHTRLWDAPNSFRPERFLGESAQTIPRGAFIPFGLGPRVCIGQGFATQEILTVLASILPDYRFALADPGAVFPEARITLRSKGGVPMRVSPR